MSGILIFKTSALSVSELSLKSASVLSRGMCLTGDETEKLLHFYLIPRVLILFFLITMMLFLAKSILAVSLFKLPFHDSNFIYNFL